MLQALVPTLALALTPTSSSAPTSVGVNVGTVYCQSLPNSTGVNSVLSANGSKIVADNDLTFTASSLPQDSFGFMITSLTAGFVPTTGTCAGNLCILGEIGRYIGPGQVLNSGSSGSFSLTVDLTRTPQPNGFVSIAAGETWYFQVWHRDTLCNGLGSRFTDGLEITFV